MKKKILMFALAIVMCVTLVGCGKTQNNNSSSNKKEDSSSHDTSSNQSSEYNYKDGVLTQIVDEEGNPKQTDFIIDGIILIGNRHDYPERDTSMEIIEYFAKEGYKKENINKDFYLGEWIEFYIDTKYSKSVDDVKIIVTPHRTVEELEKLSFSELEELASNNGGFVLDYKKPEEDNYKYVGNGYVHQDYSEGKYDILFTYKGKLAYFININETKEVEE